MDLKRRRLMRWFGRPKPQGIALELSCHGNLARIGLMLSSQHHQHFFSDLSYFRAAVSFQALVLTEAQSFSASCVLSQQFFGFLSRSQSLFRFLCSSCAQRLFRGFLCSRSTVFYGSCVLFAAPAVLLASFALSAAPAAFRSAFLVSFRGRVLLEAMVFLEARLPARPGFLVATAFTRTAPSRRRLFS